MPFSCKFTYDSFASSSIWCQKHPFFTGLSFQPRVGHDVYAILFGIPSYIINVKNLLKGTILVWNIILNIVSINF